MKDTLVQMDPKNTGFIQQESVLEAMKHCEELCGFVGSPWMIYVHPEEDIMVLHNTVLDKMASHFIFSDFKCLNHQSMYGNNFHAAIRSSDMGL